MCLLLSLLKAAAEFGHRATGRAQPALAYRGPSGSAPSRCKLIRVRTRCEKTAVQRKCFHAAVSSRRVSRRFLRMCPPFRRSLRRVGSATFSRGGVSMDTEHEARRFQRWLLSAYAGSCRHAFFSSPELGFRRAPLRGTCAGSFGQSNLVDPASSHMLVSKIKPCMSKYKFYTAKL